MLQLTEQQLGQLDGLEKMQYVDEVRKAVIADDPSLAMDEGLKPRLEAVRLGFTDGPAITQFLYYEAFAPSFYEQPAINAWLTRPGAVVEQRFSDLLQVMKSKMREV
jgi:hypothetical protein